MTKWQQTLSLWWITLVVPTAAWWEHGHWGWRLSPRWGTRTISGCDWQIFIIRFVSIWIKSISVEVWPHDLFSSFSTTADEEGGGSGLSVQLGETLTTPAIAGIGLSIQIPRQWTYSWKKGPVKVSNFDFPENQEKKTRPPSMEESFFSQWCRDS